MRSEEFTYEKAGVSVDKAKKAHQIIGNLIEKTYQFRKGKFGEVVGEYGHYAGLIDIGNGLCLALHVDGVGTKVLISQLMNKYDTVGIDLVAMHVNDIICMGAEPVALEDYLAVEETDPDLIADIMKGIVVGAEIAQMAVIGGETATMPDIIKGEVKRKGYDLSAMSVGIVKKQNIITGERIQSSDIIIGLESNGIHSNGLTLARKALLELGKLTINQNLPNSQVKVGEELLRPTKIYSREVLEILQKIEVHGLAHITGGAFSKLDRLSFGKIGFELNNLPDPPQIFKTIQSITKISDYEIYRTFNMGIGFCIIANESNYPEIEKICKKYNTRTFKIGRIISEKGVIVIKSTGQKIKL
ncbi:MAG TPA: phosphoribosylformylglycinamidine cyclo-ligase [Candidatus Deferrimicrobium sp.]|nr:phosphoribosylformylglycinamidine cyclo-ligase [Candidatus Deferrimicrobium sp.]